MADLISRKALIEKLELTKMNCTKLHDILFFDAVMAIVDNQPTAFDVEKTVDGITDLAGKSVTKGEYKAYWKAAKIVEGAAKK